jgi:hypothetical protein
VEAKISEYMKAEGRMVITRAGVRNGRCWLKGIKFPLGGKNCKHLR